MTRVLIVDDSRTTIEVVKVHLMGQGFEFQSATDADEALRRAAGRPPDIIISDLAMPTVTGVELCQKVRATPELRSCPFIIVTSKGDDASRRAAFAAGANGFLTKPIEPSHLLSLVSHLLNR